jgi:antirestriction protein ArdC
MRNLHLEVTVRILTELKAGVVPWRQPWSATPGRNTPCNGVTNRNYNGVNVVLLWMATRDHKWPTARFVTFKQALELGGHVAQGQHGFRIYFVKDLAFAEESEGNAEPNVRSVRMLKQYVVFNVAQCEGLPTRITEPPAPRLRHHDARDPLIEEFIVSTGAKIREGGDQAVFIPSIDTIMMPPFCSFDSGSAFYGVLFHELAHWTGHPSRINRDDNFRTRFGKDAYVAEELVAELAAAFICAEFDTDGDPRLPGYLMHYIRLLEGDPKAFFTAASKAQAAVDYLRELALREPAQAAE